ncbi:MAG: carbon-nitrogen hydrolase family protein [Gammaproteobacteria bacterium]|nr:carbon-nitrogen hydrolase family protein [Gammaproteobacteria bacterium]
MSGGFKLALAQFPAYTPHDWAEVEATLGCWVAEATQSGAQLLVFPEYASMSLAALFPPGVQRNLRDQIAAMQTLRDDYLSVHRRLARQHGAYILAGSFPWQRDDGRFHNRAWLCSPTGDSAFQDKRMMTRFEREQWSIAGGEQVALKVFDTALGRLAADVCYDIEFPALAGAQADAGAVLILAPSCTDTAAGHHRVHVGARARALENQCLVAVSPLVGDAPWSPAIDVNVGSAALYGPPDHGFPDDGVLAQGDYCAPGWVYAEVDPARVAQVRAQGQVFNFRHGRETAARDAGRVRTQPL